MSSRARRASSRTRLASSWARRPLSSASSCAASSRAASSRAAWPCAASSCAASSCGAWPRAAWPRAGWPRAALASRWLASRWLVACWLVPCCLAPRCLVACWLVRPARRCAVCLRGRLLAVRPGRAGGVGAGRCSGRPGLRAIGGAAVPADIPRDPGQLFPQVAHGLADILGDLAGDVAHGLGEFLLELGQIVEPAPDLLAALLGDAVHLLAGHLVVRDQALLLEPGEPRVDRAGRGGIHPKEAILQ